jgi:hypothetical protein
MRMIGIALAASMTLFKDNPIRIVILTSYATFFYLVVPCKVGFFFILCFHLWPLSHAVGEES